MSHDVLSPLPAKIAKVHVKKGDSVAADMEVITIEAMKMEMPVVSESAGVVASINVAEGAFVQQGDVLLVIE